MADVKVPISFEIYKGDELVREEILAQDVIKVGKLASSHLRLDDETVSRMHAVIETTGPERDPRDGPRLDPRHDRQRRADHQGPAAVGRRGHVRRLPRGRGLRRGAGAQETPPPQASPGAAVRPAAAFAPPPHGGLRAAAPAAPQAGTRRRRAAYAPPQQSYAPPPSFAGGARAPAPRSRSTTARAPWRSRPCSAASSPARATSSTPRGSRRTARERR